MSANAGLPAYDKPWLSVSDQLDLLESRGLTVNPRPDAEKFLWHLNYYRFSGYCLAFEESRHKFVEGTTFEDVRASYEFDVSLRDLLTEALEVIEVDCRSVVAYIFGDKGGPFGYTDPNNFRPSFEHDDWLARVREEAERSSELFVDHFRNNYAEFPDLPCWIATEIMSFGALSKLYRGLKDKFQKPIASRYSMQKGDMESALHHLSYVRNVCAHHSRVWDREWAITPRVPHGKSWQPPLVPHRDRLFVTLLLTYRVLKRCSASQKFAVAWRNRVNELMKTPPNVENALIRMGMPADWYKHPFWMS